MTSASRSKPSGARRSTSSITLSGPPTRLRSTTSLVIGQPLVLVGAQRVVGVGCSTRCRARLSASSTAWPAPLEPIGYIGCAASPSRVTRPCVHCGSGSRSHIGNSKHSAVASMSADMVHVGHPESVEVAAQLGPVGRARPVLPPRRRIAVAPGPDAHRPVGEHGAGAAARPDRVEHQFGGRARRRRSWTGRRGTRATRLPRATSARRSTGAGPRPGTAPPAPSSGCRPRRSARRRKPARRRVGELGPHPVGRPARTRRAGARFAPRRARGARVRRPAARPATGPGAVESCGRAKPASRPHGRRTIAGPSRWA